MKQTEQYGLNQWELTDRIRMEDFNADNAKIAAALAGKTGRLEKINDTILNSLCSGFGTKPNVSNWNDWDMTLFLVYVDCIKTSADFRLKVEFECLDGKTPPQTVALLEPDNLLIIFFPRHDENSLVEGVIIGGGTKVFRMPFPFKHLGPMTFGIYGINQSYVYQNISMRHFGIC